MVCPVQTLFDSRSGVGLGSISPPLTNTDVNTGDIEEANDRTDRASPLEARSCAKSLVSRPERRASTGIIGIE